jgi:hypothetical protein
MGHPPILHIVAALDSGDEAVWEHTDHAAIKPYVRGFSVTVY